MTEISLRILQYNVLARSAADTVWFPYAVSIAKAPPGQLGNLQSIRATAKALEEACSTGGIFDGPTWVEDKSETRDRSGTAAGICTVSQAVAAGMPDIYWGQAADCGSCGTEVLSGSISATESLGVACVEGCPAVDTRKIVLSWAERLPALLRRIKEHEPDLVFLEEVDQVTLQDFSVGLQGYGSAFAEPGCCVLWKLETLAADGDQRTLRYTDGRKVAVLQPLQCVADGFRLLAVGTHLHWNPCDKFQSQEARELLDALAAHANSVQIVGGDFNAGPTNVVMTEVLKAPREQNDFCLIDLHDVAANAAQAPKRFTTHCPRGPQPKLTDARRWEELDQENPVAVDYVFVHLPDGCDVLRAEVLDCGGGFEPDSTNGLPNLVAGQGSDHLPIAYQLVVKINL